jgi:hypothetical protein
MLFLKREILPLLINRKNYRTLVDLILYIMNKSIALDFTT